MCFPGISEELTLIRNFWPYIMRLTPVAVRLFVSSEPFDLAFVKTFCPKHFDKFVFAPSMGASGGINTIWSGIVQCSLALRGM